MAVVVKLTAPKLAQVIQALAKAKEKLDTELTPAARKVTIYLLSLVQRSFKSNGGKQDDWKSLSPLTLFIRKHRVNAPNKSPMILNDKGLLRNANFTFVRDEGREFGVVNNLKYASDHQFGGRTKSESIAIGSFRRRNPGGSGTHKVRAFIMKLAGGAEIPPRPFFPVSDEYLPGVMAIIRKYGRDSLGGLGGTA